MSIFSPIEEALEDFKNGKFLIVLVHYFLYNIG